MVTAPYAISRWDIFGKDRELATSFNDSTGKLYSADYAMMARSMGATGVLVEKPSDLGLQLEAAIASQRPCVLDVRIDREVRPISTGSWDLVVNYMDLRKSVGVSFHSLFLSRLLRFLSRRKRLDSLLPGESRLVSQVSHCPPCLIRLA